MEVLTKQATEDTPVVTLDAASGVFEFEGQAYPENAADFFNPILEWLDEYGESPNDSTKFVFKITYMNTASCKFILDIHLKLDEISEEGNDVKVEWYIKEEDEDMEEAIEEFSELVECDFEIKTM